MRNLRNNSELEKILQFWFQSWNGRQISFLDEMFKPLEKSWIFAIVKWIQARVILWSFSIEIEEQFVSKFVECWETFFMSFWTKSYGLWFPDFNLSWNYWIRTMFRLLCLWGMILNWKGFLNLVSKCQIKVKFNSLVMNFSGCIVIVSEFAERKMCFGKAWMCHIKDSMHHIIG